MRENAAYENVDERGVRERTERPEGRPELDHVVHPRATRHGVELVRVSPHGEGARLLDVDETAADLVPFDARSPAERKAEHGEAVVDPRVDVHGHGAWRQDAEREPARRDRGEVFGAFEERENLVERALDQLDALEATHGARSRDPRAQGDARPTTPDFHKCAFGWIDGVDAAEKRWILVREVRRLLVHGARVRIPRCFRSERQRVSPQAPPTFADPSVVASIRGASKTYARGDAPVRALVSADLDVRAGEMVALLGPSGCGKSTLLNVLSGVDALDEGSANVAGIDLTRGSSADLVTLRRERIGIVFQAFHLVPNLSAEENVALPLALGGRRDDARVASLLARVGLGNRARHFPSELSGGEQQRVALARALVHRPRLLLLDEPTGNLDSASGEVVLALLDELRREAQVAVVLATHDERVSLRADRRVRMRDGRIVADGVE